MKNMTCYYWSSISIRCRWFLSNQASFFVRSNKSKIELVRNKIRYYIRIIHIQHMYKSHMRYTSSQHITSKIRKLSFFKLTIGSVRLHLFSIVSIAQNGFSVSLWDGARNVIEWFFASHFKWIKIFQKDHSSPRTLLLKKR